MIFIVSNVFIQSCQTSLNYGLVSGLFITIKIKYLHLLILDDINNFYLSRNKTEVKIIYS